MSVSTDGTARVLTLDEEGRQSYLIPDVEVLRQRVTPISTGAIVFRLEDVGQRLQIDFGSHSDG